MLFTKVNQIISKKYDFIEKLFPPPPSEIFFINLLKMFIRCTVFTTKILEGMNNMKNRIVFFSGGKSSFAVAEYLKRNHSDDNILLYFTDVLWEDEDLLRFIYEVSDKLELPMLIHSKGITPAELMIEQKFMANSWAGICSRELKMKVSSDFIRKGIEPKIKKWYNKQFLKSESILIDPILYFGISFMEAHRAEPIRYNWQPYTVEMPLLDNDIDYDFVLKQYNIRTPRLYLKGFHHNNCKGRCIKGGKGHFKNLMLKDNKTFTELKEQEIIISEYIRYTKQYAIRSKKTENHLYKDVIEFIRTGIKSEKIKHLIRMHPYRKKCLVGIDSTGEHIKKPYTFMKGLSLAELEKQPAQCDMFDIGGCGCFSDYDSVTFG